MVNLYQGDCLELMKNILRLHKRGVMYNGKYYHLGYFDDINEAKKARQNKEVELFGDFANIE